MQTARGGHLVVNTMEKGRAVREAKTGIEVCTPADLGLAGRPAGRIDRQISALLEKQRIQRVRISPNFPAGLYRQLMKRGIQLSIIKKPACPQRLIKSRQEIASIRSSQRAAVAALDAAVALIASSRIGRDRLLFRGNERLTAEAVRRKIHIVLMEHECSASGTIVACGDQASDPHERGSGPLRAGETIIIDIFPQSEQSGYWGDLTRTVCRGPAPDGISRLYRAVRAAQSAALRAVKPGVCTDEVHAAAKEVFEQRGYKTEKKGGRHVGFIHGTGHGVGLEIHERPRVGTSGETLQPGHVITVEPGLYYSGLGGVRIEDTVVVTEKGWRYLAAAEKKFELI
jgi:Xaa-Pro aminopeptidase